MTIPIAASPLREYRPIAVVSMYIRQVSDKTLIMVRFIALAKTHLCRVKDLHINLLPSYDNYVLPFRQVYTLRLVRPIP